MSSHMISRRAFMIGAATTAAVQPPGPFEIRPKGILIESHIHLFAGDPARFPYNRGSYTPHTATVEDYVKFAREARIDHAVIVHPEPYQDDHRYLEYCFAHEPSPGYFKGTCLFDPLREDTPRRMRALAQRWPKRIVALRIHELSMTPEGAG